jgi:hypothetical protein
MTETGCFLLDQIELDSAGGFRRVEDLLPWRHALTEQSLVAQLGRPLFAMDGTNAAGILVDPRNRIGSYFDAGADVELQHHILISVGGEHLDGTLAINDLELGLMVVITGAHSERL